ncbi:uncharacterized protein J7T54_004630 [Emericellopsis cladophorae]|uniref:Asp/Glu/hydantoin racemase n=1 Tax=Emericellopsis cladophorae TaxID=2686198 RepID=A0A9Q0BH62_9HYPO|nr:uncharacterized protein J7T54_004630 [Emericellopsis cladophorae]KAI6784084.1 hypothetical protein J7T54_004630 [Emericellopsis cladophorae]
MTKILVLNPNSTESMTDGMVSAIKSAGLDKVVDIDQYTAPSSAPKSINNDQDIQASEASVIGDMRNKLSNGTIDASSYDAILVACYSVHTLVDSLAGLLPTHAITGIFEASVSTAQLLLRPHSDQKWGIVTTGKFWEEHLTHGVKSFLGQDAASDNQLFAGVFSTGLNASDFHHVPQEEVTARLKSASKKLLQTGDVRCVVMGCGGMAGLERVIRDTATEVYGKERARRIFVVDGVKAGVLQLEQTVQSKRIFG